MTPDRFRGLRTLQNETEQFSRQRGDGPATPYPSIVGRVFGNPTVPSATGHFFSVHPVDVSGSEAESSPAVLQEDTTRSLLAYVIGTKAPVAGEYLICRFMGNRWVAERMTPQSTHKVFLPGCPCTQLPQTLHMSVSRPETNNHIFQACTLQYGPTPAGLAPLALGPFSFLSAATFSDDFSSEQFWYYFTCFQGYYMLSRLYLSSVFGSPYRDTTRYTWAIGYPGNTCIPLLLSNGVIFTGGDASCIVTLSE